MKNKKVLITAIVTILLAVAGGIFGIKYTQEDVNQISEGIETIVNVVETVNTVETIEPSIVIPEGYIEDEINLEEQEVESEAFELQGEIAYESGDSSNISIQVGEYKGLTYFSQIDSRWKNKLYTSTNNSTQTMGSSACGPTCAAMIVSSVKGVVDPPTIADAFVELGYRSSNNGTYWSAFRWIADYFDIEYKEAFRLDDVKDLLENNNLVVAACGNGLFTTRRTFYSNCWICR